jgi:hypothetical protein
VLLAASAYELVLAVHVMAVVVAFGVTFAYPFMFAVGARHDPRSLPLLHRVEYTTERFLISPALLVVLAAGIFLASDGHQWGQFFVAWGIGTVIVIGALVGRVMIPTAQRAEEVARRDLGAGESAAPLSDEYGRLTRRLQTVGSLLSLLVLVTILFMVVKP